MRKVVYSKKGQEGNTLFVTIVVTAMLMMALAAYLTLVNIQNQANVRSQSWNSAIPIAEAGIEEALTHLNSRGLVKGASLAADGWSAAGGDFTVTRTIGESVYAVTIKDFVVGRETNAPIIESSGYVIRPLVLASVGAPLLASAAGGNPSANYLKRGVRVRTRQERLVARGMVAKDSIDMNGNNIRTDSFDSTNPFYSSNGMYHPNVARDNGDVAVNSSLTNSLDVGNANIYGKASVGPGGTIAVGSNGAIGSQAWHDAGNSGVESGAAQQDMNVDFPDVQRPWTGGSFIPGSGSVDDVSYEYVLDNGRYELSELAMSGEEKMIVTGDAELLVNGNVDITGKSFIYLAPGASLKLYVAGASAKIAGQGIVNSNGYAADFSYWGLPSNTSLTFRGNAAFTGTVYAPSADFTLNGGGREIIDFIGASVTKTVILNGHFSFHYDESLGRTGPLSGYIVTSWNEMPPSEIPPLSSLP